MEVKKSWLSILILLIMWSLYSSFQEVAPLTAKEMVQQEIDKKLAAFRQKESKKCREKILKRATEIVDSTLIARAMTERIDTIQRPAKPIKPPRPDMKKAKDDTAVKPLINQ